MVCLWFFVIVLLTYLVKNKLVDRKIEEWFKHQKVKVANEGESEVSEWRVFDSWI